MEQGWIVSHKKGTAAIRSVPLGVADLVGRDNLNRFGKLLIYNVNNYLIFCWNTNWNTVLHWPTICIGSDQHAS